jgi:hypothetical protein
MHPAVLEWFRPASSDARTKSPMETIPITVIERLVVMDPLVSDDSRAVVNGVVRLTKRGSS